MGLPGLGSGDQKSKGQMSRRSEESEMIFESSGLKGAIAERRRCCEEVLGGVKIATTQDQQYSCMHILYAMLLRIWKICILNSQIFIIVLYQVRNNLLNSELRVTVY